MFKPVIYDLPYPVLRHLVYRSFTGFRGLDKFVPTRQKELEFMRVIKLIKPLKGGNTYLPNHEHIWWEVNFCLSCGAIGKVELGSRNPLALSCRHCTGSYPEVNAARLPFWRWFPEWKAADQQECIEVLTKRSKTRRRN